MPISFEVSVNVNFPGLDGVITKLDQLLRGNQKIMDNQTLLNEDVAKLKAAVDANTTAISALGDLVKADTATIENLNKQIADLKDANPALDLSGLEAEVSALGANNSAAQALVAPVAGSTDAPAQ